ncbi:MAG: methyltransferase domain-containing protein [Gemmataceae bacterium]|nr:methyltransferase domain-containing protein [Gemmataceae bacterium]
MIAEKTVYDDVPYGSKPFAITHPDRLAAIAGLLGLNPPKVETARVLEIACSSGGNLLPMAAFLPSAHFTGIDFSSQAIDEANQSARQAGLKNIQFLHADIANFNHDGPPFDYIISHGVFSWITPALQEKHMEICSRFLSANGVAFVSYNTFPGWNMRGMLRDLMSYHAKKFASPQEKVHQARQFIEFLASTVPSEGNPYGAFIKFELDLLRQNRDSYIYHEHLVGENHPFYLHEFVAMARSHGLEYLADADLRAMAQLDFPDSVKKVLESSMDRIDCEQYMDFLRNRMFRNSLLVRSGNQPKLNVDPKIMENYHLGSSLKLSGEARPLESPEPDVYPINGGGEIAIRGSCAKACFRILGKAWPDRIAFADLLNQGIEMVGNSPLTSEKIQAERSELAGAFLLVFLNTPPMVTDISFRPMTFPKQVSAKPRLNSFNLLSAKNNGALCDPRNLITELGATERFTVTLLDGSRNCEDFSSYMTEVALADEMKVHEKEVVVTDPARLKEIFTDQWHTLLNSLSQLGLLEE